MKITNIIFALIAIILLIAFSSFAGTPKNIILMISDGCGYHHVDATSMFEYGKTGSQIYEQFPVKYGMSTYSANGVGYDPDSIWSSFDYTRKKPTDSGASATAMATGVKTYNGAIGVDVDTNKVTNLVEQAESLGKSTGVVTSVMLSHATPAAFVAHNKQRRNYVEIAREMILDSPLDVIMGAGHPFYDKNGQRTSEGAFNFVGGEDVWNALINGEAGNDADGNGVADSWLLIQDRAEFQQLMTGATPRRVIGIPRIATTLQQERSGDKDAEAFAVPFIETVPTLEEMTKAALNILSQNHAGFFVMIEGGAVDWAGHDNKSGRMIEEQIGFNQAVAAVVDWIEKHSSWDESLVIVTSDHETGYLTGLNSGTGKDGKPVWNPIENRGKGVMPGMEWHSGGHTNSLVPFFAKGAGSNVFHQFADKTDPVWGRYLDNAELGQALFLLFEKELSAP